VETWTDAYTALVGTVQRCSVVEVAADGASLVGHTKSYTQVLLPAEAPGGGGSVLGCVVEARIVWAGRWSVKGEVVRVVYRPPPAVAGGGRGPIPDGEVSGAAARSSLEVAAAPPPASAPPADPPPPRPPPAAAAGVRAQESPRAAHAAPAPAAALLLRPPRSRDEWLELLLWVGMLGGLVAVLLSGALRLAE
jgi:hypothetical protein